MTDTPETESDQTPRRGMSRRALLTGGAAGAGLGAILGWGSAAGFPALRPNPGSAVPSDDGSIRSAGVGGDLPGFGGEALPCHGAHQAGITTPSTAHARFVAYRLRPEVDADGVRRLFRILTEDIEGLASGAAPLADPEPELAARPSRLSVTVGVGAGLVDRVDASRRPEWLKPLPAFAEDRLDERYSDGDLLILLQADDPLPLAHAARMIHRDLTGFAEHHWTQQGFRQSRGSEADGTTMRNLMGQVDGTVNPHPDEEDFDPLVWIGADGGWMSGGTALVLRRIRMELDTWDQIDRPGREITIGRTLDDGAPLTGGDEHTPIDFEATTPLGLKVIPMAAHARRAHSTDPNERIFRRAVNYDDGTEAGLLFACYQRDPYRQFVPIQQRLDEMDMLNEWVTHTGSAVFAMLPGFAAGETLGASLTG